MLGRVLGLKLDAGARVGGDQALLHRGVQRTPESGQDPVPGARRAGDLGQDILDVAEVEPLKRQLADHGIDMHPDARLVSACGRWPLGALLAIEPAGQELRHGDARHIRCLPQAEPAPDILDGWQRAALGRGDHVADRGASGVILREVEEPADLNRCSFRLGLRGVAELLDQPSARLVGIRMAYPADAWRLFHGVHAHRHGAAESVAVLSVGYLVLAGASRTGD